MSVIGQGGELTAAREVEAISFLLSGILSEWVPLPLPATWCMCLAVGETWVCWAPQCRGLWDS